MTYLTFNGRDSKDFGVYISGSGTFDAPKRDTEAVAVPGRNGVLLFDNGRYENLTITYPAFISQDFAENFDAFKAFMLSQSGYHRLEDTYHPDEYRLASYEGPLAPEVGAINRYGHFDIVFNCKPQRFLKSGEETVEITQDMAISNPTLYAVPSPIQTEVGTLDIGSYGMAIINPTLYAAAPLIRAYGVGIFYIGSYGIEITEADEYTDIDCDIQDAFKGATNCNGNIVLLSNDFPKIEPGKNNIAISGITKLEILPRWYTI